MAGWFARSFGPCIALALCSCAATPTQKWEHRAGAAHPLAGKIYRVEDGAMVSQGDLIADATAADFVLIGERPDNLDHHRLQAYIVDALEGDARKPRALAFEMVGTDRQLAIVEYLNAHPGDAAGLGIALEWARSGWPDWALYEPIAQAALDNGGQIIAADLDARQKRAVFAGGPEALRGSFVQRTGLDQRFSMALTNDLHDELDHTACGQAPPDVLAGMYRVERARDAMMADRLAVASGRAGGILIAGNGQVRNDRGVPWYLARREPGARVVTIGLLEVQDDARRPSPDLPYDYVWFTPRVGDQDPCAAREGDLQRLRSSG